MNHPPDHDPELTRFLQQHQPQTPAVSPELEERILQAIHAAETAGGTASSKVVQLRQQLPLRGTAKQPRLWLVSGGIAASLVAGLISYRLLTPPKPNAAELASLEDFIENNWQSTVSNNSDTEMFPVADSTVN